MTNSSLKTILNEENIQNTGYRGGWVEVDVPSLKAVVFFLTAFALSFFLVERPDVGKPQLFRGPIPGYPNKCLGES